MEINNGETSGREIGQPGRIGADWPDSSLNRTSLARSTFPANSREAEWMDFVAVVTGMALVIGAFGA